MKKKLHKLSRMHSKIFGWVVRPICKIDNKGAYTGSTHWQNVDCINCLSKKKLK